MALANYLNNLNPASIAHQSKLDKSFYSIIIIKVHRNLNRNQSEMFFKTKSSKPFSTITRLNRANSSNANQGLLRTLLPLQLPESTTIGIGSNYHHQIPIETGTPSTLAELSKAECDIDTLKKMKLGVRSTLWSRPSTGKSPTSNGHHQQLLLQQAQPSSHHKQSNGNPSDYSIAV